MPAAELGGRLACAPRNAGKPRISAELRMRWEKKKNGRPSGLKTEQETNKYKLEVITVNYPRAAPT